MAHRNHFALRTLFAALAAASLLAGCYETSPVEPVCTTEFAPVCGDDDVTYANDCLAAAAGAEVAHTGPCRIGNTCTTDDQCDIGARCELPRCAVPSPMPTCTPGAPCPIPPMPRCGGEGGSCELCACAEIYAPVCGTDGVTYGNECEAACAHVTVASSGECGTTCTRLVCPPIWCEYGFAVDEHGCSTCECNPPPICPDVLCGLYCEFGYALDARGCSTCECNPRPICEPLACDAMWCEYGYMLDPSGCPTCECNPPPICPPVYCDLYCEYGYATGPDGCETCSCNPPPVCLPVTCDLYCEFGYATGADGCEICSCNPPSELCASDRECGAGLYCDFSMPTCAAPACLPGAPCPPAMCWGHCSPTTMCAPVACALLFCEFGFARGPDGCEICECNDPPPPPPPVRLCLDDAGCSTAEYCDHSVCFTAPCPPGMACPSVCYGACYGAPEGGGGVPTPR